MSNRQHKYLGDPVLDHIATEQPYNIEEGIIVDAESRPNARKAYDEFTRYWVQTPQERKAEEASWVARSGPCITIRPAQKETAA